MKLNKLFAYIAASALLFGSAACSDDDTYSAGPKVDGAEAYFPVEMAAKAFSVSEEKSINIPVCRVKTEEALTLSVLADAGEAQELFEIPAAVTFAAGEATTDLVIAFDGLEDGKEYPIQLMLNDAANTTPYGNSQIAITIAPWPWEKLGTGKFRDDWLTRLYNIDPTEVDVTIHEHKSRKGVYMIEDMYGWDFLTEAFEASKEELEKGWDSSYTTTNITINASDPNAVTIGLQSTGIVNKDLGLFMIATYVSTPGTLVDGVITFPKQGLAFAYNGGNNHVAANESGMFRIILPGYEATDYSLAAAYAGMKVGADNQTATPVFNFTYGADVTGIGYTFANGDVTAKADTYVAGIVDGSDTNAAEVADFEVGAGKVSISAGLKPGVYTLVAVPQDKNGEYVAAEATVCQFYFPGVGAAEDHPCEVAVKVGKVSENAPSLVAKYPDYAAFYWEITGTDIKSVKTYINKTALIEAVKNGELASAGIADLQAVMDAYGTAMEAEDIAALNEEGSYWNLAVKLDAATSYTMLVEAENIYGEKKFVESTPITTDAIPYSGDLKVGAYYMSCTITPQTGDPMTFENDFELNPTQGSDTEFTVKNLGIENGASWHATYDAETSKLTVNGLEVGYEDDGNAFGGGYGYYDADKTMVYGYYSFASDESDGSDPCVFSIDPTTKEISAIDVTFAVAVFKSGSLAGYHGYFVPENTTIAYVETEAAKASVKPMSVRPVKVPFSSVRVPAQSNKVVAARMHNTLASEMTIAVRDTRAADAGHRTLSVKTAKCEPLPKQPTRKAEFKMTADAGSLTK